MPNIPISFEGVETFENLPIGSYMGSIDKLEYRQATEPGKFDQLMAQYIVIDEGELLGRKSSEFLSMSPKAMFRLKRWFDKFGLADGFTGIEVDDETNLVTDPDLIAVNVIFRVYEDPKPYKGEKQIRTELVEVLDEVTEPAPAPARAPAKAAAAAPAPVEEEAAEAEPEAEAPAPAPRRFAPRAAATATATGQARRTLR